MILHIINTPPANDTLKCCLKLMNMNDTILFIEDGVYSATVHCVTTHVMPLLPKQLKIRMYALNPDIMGRGLQEKIHTDIIQIDYDGFVDLVTEHEVIESWK